jgi:hypothetical protein
VSEFKDEIFKSRPSDPDFPVKGGGHDWEFLARLFIDKNMPEVKDELYFDSESGTFCVYSENLEALQYFALEFRNALDDEKMIAIMTYQFDNKELLQTEYNMRQFDMVVDKFKSRIKGRFDFFYSAGQNEIYRFTDGLAQIEFNKVMGTITYYNSESSFVVNFDVKRNYYDSDALRFERFYDQELFKRDLGKALDRMYDEYQAEARRKTQKQKNVKQNGLSR